MLDVRRKKVKAIYFNAFHCPECGLELHQDNIVLTTYPAQYCYYCDCGFRTTSFQEPGFEYEFEDENLPPAFPERIAETFELDRIVNALNNVPLQNFIHTTDPAIIENVTYNIDNFTVSTDEAIENIKTVQEAFADSMGYSYV